MKSKTVFKIFFEVLFYTWLFCYGLTVLCFFIALLSKIFNPDINNLNWNQFAVFGLVLLGLLIINILALKRKTKQSA